MDNGPWRAEYKRGERRSFVCLKRSMGMTREKQCDNSKTGSIGSRRMCCCWLGQTTQIPNNIVIEMHNV